MNNTDMKIIGKVANNYCGFIADKGKTNCLNININIFIGNKSTHKEGRETFKQNINTVTSRSKQRVQTSCIYALF